jgi:Tol biopolymer transport system component
MSRWDWLFLLAGLVLVIPGTGLPRSAGGSTTSTQAARPLINIEADQNAKRRVQPPIVEIPDRPAAAEPDTTDDVAPKEAVVVPADAPRGPQIEIWAMNADGTNPRRIAAIPDYPIINSPEISPDREWVAVDGWNWDQNLRDAHLLIVNLETGLVKDLGLGAMPTWSLDGQWIAYSKYGPEGGIFIREVDGERVRLIDRNGWGIQWSPDGSKLAYTRGSNVIVHDLVAGLSRELFPSGDQPYSWFYWNCTWSPDSRRICFKGMNRNGNDEFGIISATGDGPQLRIRCDGSNFDPDIGWHRDGLRITIPRKVTPGQPAQIFEFDPDGDQPPVLVAGQPADRNNAGNCWSRDGKTLIFVSWK